MKIKLLLRVLPAIFITGICLQLAQSESDYMNSKVKVYLNNGRKIEGKVIAQEGSEIKLEVLDGAGTVLLQKSVIKRIEVIQPPPPPDKPKEMKPEELEDFVKRSKEVGKAVVDSSKTVLSLSADVSKRWNRAMKKTNLWGFGALSSKPLAQYEPKVEAWYKANQALVSKLAKQDEAIKAQVEELRRNFYGSTKVMVALDEVYTTYKELYSLALNPAGYTLEDYRSAINRASDRVDIKLEALNEF